MTSVVRRSFFVLFLALAGYLVGFKLEAVSRPAWGYDMVYAHGMAVAVKVDGSVLREVGGDVYLPFGSEYSVVLKNLSGRRAVVHVEIDGERKTDGGLVIESGSSVDLERAIGGDLLGGRKFKFIEKTEEVERYRGNRVDDGLVRVTYQFEKPKTEITWTTTTWGGSPYTTTTYPVGGLTNTGATSSVFCSASASASGGAKNQDGITVEGSKSYQRFREVSVGDLESETHSVVLRLRGDIGGQRFSSAVTVKTKKVCSSCGRSWPYQQEYCGKDGTYLR